MKTPLVLLCFALVLTACGGDARTPTTTAPEPTQGGQVVVPAPTDTPSVSSPTQAPPADTPTTTPPDTPTPEPSDTPTLMPTSTTAVSRPRATPTSSGPLDFQFFIAGCRRAPTAEKPGNAFISISIEARGGNGVYRYFHEAVELQNKFFEVERELGTSVNGDVTVISGDGQSLEKEYFFATTNLECSG